MMVNKSIESIPALAFDIDSNEITFHREKLILEKLGVSFSACYFFWLYKEQSLSNLYLKLKLLINRMHFKMAAAISVSIRAALLNQFHQQADR